jgi:hypothetical protein
MSGKKAGGAKAKSRVTAVGFDIIENSFNSVLNSLGSALKNERDTMIEPVKPVWATKKTHLNVRKGDRGIPDSFVGARADWHDVEDLKARLVRIERIAGRDQMASISTNTLSPAITSATAAPYYPLDCGTINTHLQTSGNWSVYTSTHSCLRGPQSSGIIARFTYDSEMQYTGFGGVVTAEIEIIHSTTSNFASSTVKAKKTVTVVPVAGTNHVPLHVSYVQTGVDGGYFCPRVVLTIAGGSGVSIQLGCTTTTGDFNVETQTATYV